MVTKIGKLLICIAFVTGLYGQAAVELQVLSTTGQPLKAAAVGVPFIISVSLKNFNEQTDEPRLAGLDALEVLHKSQQLRSMSINGVTTTERIFIFQVRARTAGTITIGPASITKPQAIASAPIMVPIEAQSTQAPLKSGVHYELTVDKKDLFVGQKVPFRTRFSYAQPALKLRGIEEPEAQGLVIKMAKEIETKNVSHNGSAYIVHETAGFLYPEQAGTIVIPALRAEYTMPDRSFGMFSLFTQAHEIYSNPVTLAVHPLPPTDKQAQGVGTFTNFYATLTQSKVAQGEGTTLTLVVEGTGNVEGAHAPSLILPEGLKYYESKVAVEGQEPQLVKRFEYVIQGIKPGNWLIPEQSFTYFDPEKKKYGTLHSKPLALVVEPASLLHVVQEPLQESVPEELAQVQENRKYPEQAALELPFWLFALLLALPLVGLLIQSLLTLFNRFSNKGKSNYRVFERACTRSKAIAVQNMYLFIKEVFRQYIGKESVTDEDIMHLLALWNLPKQKLKEWQLFINKLLAQSSYAPKHSNYNEKELKGQAYKWFTLFAHKSKELQQTALKNSLLVALISVHILGLQVYAQSDSKQLLNEASAARRAQQHAWGSTNALLDKVVDGIKQQAGAHAQSRHSPLFTTVYDALLCIPFGVWQIFFICLWWALIFYGSLVKIRHGILLVLLFCIVSSGVGIIMYGRYGQWAFVKNSDALLYIGPDKQYPRKGELRFLDEVYLRKKHNVWYYVSSPVGTGWIQSKDVELVERE